MDRYSSMPLNLVSIIKQRGRIQSIDHRPYDRQAAGGLRPMGVHWLKTRSDRLTLAVSPNTPK